MIKTLRKKFIAIAMLSTALVLFVIIGAINIANYINTNANLDARLELIAYNGGTFPDMNYDGNAPAAPDNSTEVLDTPAADIFQASDDSAAPDDSTALDGSAAPGNSTAPDDSAAPDDSMVPPAPDSGSYLDDQYGRHGIDKETPFETRYFSVLLYENGNVSTIDTGKITSVSTSEAGDYATSLYDKGKTKGFIDQYKYLSVSTTNTNGDNMVLYVFINCSKELMTIRTYALASIGISIIGLLVVFILVCYFSKIVTKPMAESYEKQKRFITDASHEIKTPLTIIDANTEVLEMMEGENEWTVSIRKQIARLTALTEKLVFLSRMDEDSTRLEMLEFNISDAILDTAMPFETVAESKGKTLDISVAPDINYTGSETNIRQMVSLLLDNAIKYSSESGAIRLDFSVAANGKTKLLSVWNTVDEIEAGKLDYLFERFYRIDKSRNSKTGGFGIGLSVVQAIVQAHNGKVSAKSEDGKSIEFTISL